MAILVQNRFMTRDYNNYLIAGNVCNAFVLGEVGSKDDFFLVGAEPPDESSYPLLTGNVLDSEGNVLFRLVRNLLVVNPGGCSKFTADQIGYEIHDSAGNLIFRIKTVFESLPGESSKCFVTTLAGNFYNKNGELVCSANSGEKDERIDSNTKSIFGFSGGSFGSVSQMTPDDLAFAALVLITRGQIHEPLRGNIEGQELSLDGKAVIGAKINRCKLHISTADFVIRGGLLANNHIEFKGQAAEFAKFVRSVDQSGPSTPDAYARMHAQLKVSGISQDERNKLENILDEFDKVPLNEKPSIAQAGLDWVSSHSDKLRSLADLIRGIFTAGVDHDDPGGRR